MIISRGVPGRGGVTLRTIVAELVPCVIGIFGSPELVLMTRPAVGRSAGEAPVGVALLTVQTHVSA